MSCPYLVAVIGIFSRPNGAGVNTRRDDDCVKPTFRFRFLEKVISDPKHQPLPIPWQFAVLSSLSGVELSKSWASRVQLARNGLDNGAPFQGGTSPIRECFPIDVPGYGIG